MCVTTATEYEHDIWRHWRHHYSDVIMSAMTCQITRVSILCSTVCSGADKTKHQGSATLAFVRVNHQSPVASPHKGSATPKMFPFDDVIMTAMSISHDELIPRIPFRMLSIVLIFTWRDLFIYFSQLHRSIPSIPYWTHSQYMMTSSNRNIFRVTGPLWGEFTGHRRIPLKASDVELWCFLDLHLNKRLSKQSRRGDLRRHRSHYDVTVMKVVGRVTLNLILLNVPNYFRSQTHIARIVISYARFIGN